MQDLKAVIQKCLEKDTRAEYALYKYCFQKLMVVCYRYTLDEDDAAALLNKGFLKILNNLNSYQPDRPFDPWMKTILVNTILDELRSRKRSRQHMPLDNLEELAPQSHPSGYNDAESKLNADDYLKYIQQLPEPSREVFNLYVFEGCSHKEIAEALQIPEGTSKWHLSNARALLRKMISHFFNPVKSKAV